MVDIDVVVSHSSLRADCFVGILLLDPIKDFKLIESFKHRDSIIVLDREPEVKDYGSNIGAWTREVRREGEEQFGYFNECFIGRVEQSDSVVLGFRNFYRSLYFCTSDANNYSIAINGATQFGELTRVSHLTLKPTPDEVNRIKFTDPVPIASWLAKKY